MQGDGGGRSAEAAEVGADKWDRRLGWDARALKRGLRGRWALAGRGGVGRAWEQGGVGWRAGPAG